MPCSCSNVSSYMILCMTVSSAYLLLADNLCECIPFDSSSAIMVLITLCTGPGLVTFVTLDPLAPMICVAHWNSAMPSSKMFTLLDW